MGRLSTTECTYLPTYLCSCNYRPQGVPGTIAVAWGAFAL